VNYLRELIHRLRLGQRDRAIARDLHISRITARKCRGLAAAAGYLDPRARVLVRHLGLSIGFYSVPLGHRRLISPLNGCVCH